MTYGYDHGNRPTMHHYIISSENSKSLTKKWNEEKRWSRTLDEDEKMLKLGSGGGASVGHGNRPDMHYVVMLAQEIRDSKRTVNSSQKNEDFQVEIYKVC